MLSVGCFTSRTFVQAVCLYISEKLDYFHNHSDIKPYFLQLHLWYWYWWCHCGPLLKHWLSLIRLWHCCSLCVPMVTMCGVYFPPTKAATSIKPLVSIFFRSRRFFIHTAETHLLVWWILIKWQATFLAVSFDSSLQQPKPPFKVFYLKWY